MSTFEQSPLTPDRRVPPGTQPEPDRHEPRPRTRGRATTAWWADRPHPVRLAVALVAAPVALTVLIGLLGGWLFGRDDDTALASRLVAVVVVAALALTVVGRARAWRRTGAAGPPTWRDVGLLGVPTVAALAPLVTGIDLPAAGTLVVLVLGYAATGVFEELWHRGVVLDTLRVQGVRRSALVGAALFGASHLANVVFGQPVAVSMAQSVGAFCFGLGFGIFRWRTNAIWLLAPIHALSDLMFKVTNLHGGVLWLFLVGNDILMLLWGLWCLRGLDDVVSRPDGTADEGSAAAR